MNDQYTLIEQLPYDSTICDWIWENPASTHNYKYLEILNLIIWSIITQEGSRCLHEICHDSIAIYNLSTHQLLGE